MDPGTLLAPFDGDLPESTWEDGYGLGSVANSACAFFNIIDAAWKLPDSTCVWPSVQLSPNPAVYSSNKASCFDVANFQSRLFNLQSGVAYDHGSSNTPRAPDPALLAGYLSTLSPNPENPLVPPTYLIQSDQPGTEKTSTASRKRKRSSIDTVRPSPFILIANPF